MLRAAPEAALQCSPCVAPAWGGVGWGGVDLGIQGGLGFRVQGSGFRV